MEHMRIPTRSIEPVTLERHVGADDWDGLAGVRRPNSVTCIIQCGGGCSRACVGGMEHKVRWCHASEIRDSELHVVLP